MPDSTAPSVEDDELRAHVEQALSATYEVEQEIGRGGMGIVYRARDKRLKRRVAIKLLPPELSFRRDIRSRFLREAETAAQLNHPNIVPIYSVDEVGNLVFFVMACVEGDNLARQVQKRGPLPIADAQRWLTEIAEALAFAHGRGVVHRDIKPDNILIDAIDGRALVTDFGIARAAYDSGETSRLTATGMAIGTPAYMSPEQASGDRDLDARSDLYSLGIVAYQMLTGEPPFIGNTTPALLVKHLAEMPVPVSQRRRDVPPTLEAIVMRLLEKAPEQRFQSGGELLQALRTGVVPPTPALPTTGVGSVGVGGGTLGASVRFDFNKPIGGMPMPSPSAGSSGGAAPYQQNTQYPASVSYGNTRYGVAAGAGGAVDSADAMPPEHVAKFEDPKVKAYRRKLGPYLFVNGAIVCLAPFTGGDMLGITTIWTVLMAWWYAKLWSDGYDWHHVLKQPQDRMLGEVISDAVDNVISFFSAKKRAELRASGRQNRLKGALSMQPTHGAPVAAGAAGAAGATGMVSLPVRDDELGEYLPAVQGARDDQVEIERLLATLPDSERKRIANVSQTAAELRGRIESIAGALAHIDRDANPAKAADIDTEIATLEAEANPLDTQRSETRVRRLAALRRERRALADATGKREARRNQLESCRIALENVRLDLVRLRTGNSSVQSVTMIAEQAMALAREVDIAVSAASEVRDAMVPAGSARGARS